jgi:hypothetical protein
MGTASKNRIADTEPVKRGDRVAVLWGIDELIGPVEEVYGPQGSRHVMVRVPFHGPEGEILHEESISFPIDEVRLVEAA